MAQNQALYNIVVEVHSNMCDCHRRIDVECIEEEYLINHIPQGMSLEEAFSQGWEEYSEGEDGYSFWRNVYSIEEYTE